MKIHVYFDELYPDLQLWGSPSEYTWEYEVSEELAQRYNAARMQFLAVRKQLADAIGVKV